MMHIYNNVSLILDMFIAFCVSAQSIATLVDKSSSHCKCYDPRSCEMMR